MLGIQLWLLGFPSPVIEFFLFGVALFLVTAVYLATNLEPFEGIEGEESDDRDRQVEDTPTGGD